MNEQARRECMFKEIEILQGVIGRMARNSFMLKGWAVTIVIAALLLKGTSWQGVLVGAIPLLVFWLLDAYYLRQERLYRRLYGWVIANRPKSDDHLFDMNAYRFVKDTSSLTRVFFSITLAWYYGSVAVLLIVYAVSMGLA